MTKDTRPETSAVRSDIRRLVLAIGGCLVVVVALVAVLNQGFDIVGCTAAAPFGWIIPLLSVAIIVAVAWALFSQMPRGSARPDGHRSVACASCGRTVLTDWRLCPYCGSALAPEASAQPGSRLA